MEIICLHLFYIKKAVEMKWHISTKIIIRNASHFVIKLAKKNLLMIMKIFLNLHLIKKHLSL